MTLLTFFLFTIPLFVIKDQRALHHSRRSLDYGTCYHSAVWRECEDLNPKTGGLIVRLLMMTNFTFCTSIQAINTLELKPEIICIRKQLLTLAHFKLYGFLHIHWEVPFAKSVERWQVSVYFFNRNKKSDQWEKLKNFWSNSQPCENFTNNKIWKSMFKFFRDSKFTHFYWLNISMHTYISCLQITTTLLHLD